MTMFFEPNPMYEAAARAHTPKQEEVGLVPCSDGVYRDKNAKAAFEREQYAAQANIAQD